MADRHAIWHVATTLVCVLALVAPPVAVAQQPTPQDLPDDTPFPAQELAPSKALRTHGVGTIAPPTPSTMLGPDLWPDLSRPTLTWIAVVVILLLTLQSKPVFSWRNIDGVVLALAAVLLALRDNRDVIRGDPVGFSVQWWAYLLLAIVGLYWLARGLKLLMSKTAPALGPNVSERALVILVLAGLFVAFSFVARAPISAASRDGLIGGIYTAETAKLPYGDALGHDARSPVLYLLHAGAARLVQPTYQLGGEPVSMRWQDREAWLDEAAWETVDLTPVRLVNALLFVLLFAALAGIGHRLHSVAVGQTLVAIVCFFPGALECFARPDIMLPTVLLAWSIAFVKVPGVGGILSVFLLVLAGLAWPWAWLALPAMLAYYVRRGWHALGAPIGLLAGIALALIGVTALVAPTLPRHDGALAGAGITPDYTARLSDDGTPIIERHRPDELVERTFKSWLWRLLLRPDEIRLDSPATQSALPNGVDAGSVRYRDVVAGGEARELLQRRYREALARESAATRWWTALRTLLEATWKPATVPAQPRTGTWELWAGGASGSAARWTWIRRSSKIVAGLLSLLVALALIRGPRRQLHHLIGALLMVSAATLLVSWIGPTTNWVWLMPALLGVLAVRGEPVAASVVAPVSPDLPPYEHGPAPRITVEK